MPEVEYWDIIDYAEAWERQKKLVAGIQTKRNRSVLALCQHPSVITIGRNGTGDNVVADRKFLEHKGIKVYDVDRGGDVTLHNPGQIVGYPIFNLLDYKQDLHWFLREIEECIIETLEDFGIKSGRVEGLTGVWVDGRRKICAMGLHCSRWVTSHGFAMNVCNDLREFGFIVPCGLTDKEVTSIEKELGTKIEINIVQEKLVEVFCKHF